jgi:TolB-like protein
MSGEIFISYRRADQAKARLLHAMLKQRGVDAWYDAQVAAGDDWRRATAKALDAAPIFVLLFSKNASESDDIGKELAAATFSKKLVIPVRIENIKPSGEFLYELASRNWFDAFEDTEARFEVLADRLAALVKGGPNADVEAFNLGATQPAREIKPAPRPMLKRPVVLAGFAAAALALAVLVVVGLATRWGAPAQERSIAVLPFASESADSERAYLGRVLSGEITDILSRLNGMEVIARNSSFTFGPDADVPEVGRKLGVAHVLTGTVKEEGKDIQVSATLVDATTGRVIWTRSDTVPFAPENVPALQKEIAERVAGAMSIAFDVPASSRLTGGSTKSLEAYDSYLRGLDHWWSGGPARDAFARATELDPDYAEAWAGLAITTASVSMSLATPEKARELQNAAYAMAERGVKLAPDLSVTQACYGGLSTTQGKWGQAEIATLKAMAISRADLSMNHRQNTLSRVGRASESYELMVEQQATDPLSSRGAFVLMGALPATGRQEELLEIATRQDWFHAKSATGQMYGLMARVHARQPAAAIRDSLQLLAQQPDRALAEFAAGLVAVIDNRDKARAYLRAAYDDPAFQHSAKWEIIPFLAAWAGDDELVLRVWRDGLPVNNMRVIYVWGEAFAGARARPEFKQLARDLGLVDYWRTYRWADKCRPLAGDDFECG